MRSGPQEVRAGFGEPERPAATTGGPSARSPCGAQRPAPFHPSDPISVPELDRSSGDASAEDALTPQRSPSAQRIAAGREVLRQERRAIDGLLERIGTPFSDAVGRVLDCKGMVVVTGMGKAGLVGAKISATLASTGTPSLSLHPGEALHGDLGRIRQADLVLALSNSGETAEIKALLGPTRRIGAGLIAITESAESTLGRLSDLVLELGPVDEACPLGLAPTASTSAMLALGDALAMVVAEERGLKREEYALYHPAGSLGRRLMQVDEVMRTGDELPLVPEGSTLSEVLEITSHTPGRPGAALIVDADGRLAGIFTDGDLRRLLENAKGRPRDERVDDHMGRTPKTCEPGQLVEQAMRLLREHRVDQLAVIDAERRPVGLLDVQDVLDLKL